ncbi:hypothetical protein ACP4OV_009463 [Aristida adscensionis]
MGAGTRCELCGGAAAVHCAADAAFLCLRCDARVHGANFLASRHLRRRIGDAASESASAATGGSCVSTADSAESTAAATPMKKAAAARRGRKKRRARAEVVIEGWAKRMGLPAAAARRRASAAACALRALGRGVAAARVPLRVAMAAALWTEIAATAAACGGCPALLRRLEATALVPARLVLTVATWMARAAAAAAIRPSSEDAEEGWAECS